MARQQTQQALARILLADDDLYTRKSLAEALRADGHAVSLAGETVQAADHLDAGTFDVVIVDAELRGEGGTAGLLRRARCQGGPAVIVLAQHGSVRQAVDMLHQGADNYLLKPVTNDDLRQALDRALSRRQSQPVRAKPSPQMRGIVGEDFRLSRVYEVIQAVASSRTTVLITGESGTGKSLVARMIHAGSDRASAPFVDVCCGAMPDSLLESELFGHVRGAFTGAVADKAGKFEAADGGTIFLDEISTASPRLQVKLLRVLQERCFEAVGSNSTRSVDVRVLLATNHDLAEEVRLGRFRHDLYYRVNVVNIELPPLRHRQGDIPLLAKHFLSKYDPRGRLAGGIADDAMAVLKRYDWPGNIRELENCIERASVLCRGQQVMVDDLPPSMRAVASSAPTVEQAASSLTDALAEPERRIIKETLRSHGGSRQRTAAALGISRCTLYKKMKKYGLLDSM